jgi:hypothetical protein
MSLKSNSNALVASPLMMVPAPFSTIHFSGRISRSSTKLRSDFSAVRISSPAEISAIACRVRQPKFGSSHGGGPANHLTLPQIGEIQYFEC